MTDTKRWIARAAQQAPTPAFTLDDLHARREGHARRRRLSAGLVGGALTVTLLGVAFVSLSSRGGGGAIAGGTSGLLPATRHVDVGANGYAYQHVVLLGTCPGTSDGSTTIGIVDGLAVCPPVHLDFESWWRADGSGVIKVNEKQNYGIMAGSFGPGEFPTEGDLSGFPLDPVVLRAFLLERSGANGASPRPDITPAPGVAVDDGLLWNAIQDYLGDTQYLNATPALRAAMLDVLATLPMVRVDPSSTDPAGRRAIALTFDAYDQHVEVFMDPATHDFLAMTKISPASGERETVVVEAAGATATTTDAPTGAGLSVRLGP